MYSITLTAIVSILLLLSSIWLLVILLRRQNEYIFRALLVFLFFLSALIYLQQSESSKLTLYDIKNKILPERTQIYNYHIEKGDTSQSKFTQYVFDDPRPELKLTRDDSGQYFHMKDVSFLNKVLRHLNLPKVSSGVPELSSITSSKYDMHRYRWDNYQPGILTVDSTLCRYTPTLKTYNCVSVITITKRY